MSPDIYWTLPPRGDGRQSTGFGLTRGDFAGSRQPSFAAAGLTDERAGNFSYYDYLQQVARAAEVSGFDGLFIPWEAGGEDPWIVASGLVRQTRRLKFLPELQATFATPVYLAKMSVSFQRLSGSRLGWKLDIERDIAERRAHGDLLDGDDWFERLDEYLQAAKGVWSTHPYELRGRFYDVGKGGFQGPLSGWPLPTIVTSGSSDRALELAAKHADVHLFASAELGRLHSELGRLDALAAARGRRVRPGLRLRVVARHSEAEAVRDASEQGSGLGLVGSYGQVRSRLQAYIALGVDHLILEGVPHLEEAYRLGEQVVSELRARAAPAADVLTA